MEFRKGQLCQPKKPSPYLARKYGKPRPVVRIEAKDTDLWPGGWKWQDGNPVCMAYAMRAAVEDLPLSGVVYYAKVLHLGELFHETELEPFVWSKNEPGPGDPLKAAKREKRGNEG